MSILSSEKKDVLHNGSVKQKKKPPWTARRLLTKTPIKEERFQSVQHQEMDHRNGAAVFSILDTLSIV